MFNCVAPLQFNLRQRNRKPIAPRLAKKSRSAFEIGLAILLVHTLTSRVVAEDWFRWRGPNLDGISTEKSWSTAWAKEGPKQLWRASVGTGFSSVSVSKGRVFTLGNQNETDTVYCIDANTGASGWTNSYPCPLDPQYYEGGPHSTPAVDGDFVYTLSKRGHLFCFEAANGKIVWQTNLLEQLGVIKPRWGFAGSPLVEGNLLLLNVGNAGTAVDKKTGKLVWTSGKEPAGYSTPMPMTVGGQRCVLIFAAKALVAVRISDGHELWRHEWLTRWDINNADPIVAGDKVFVSSFDQGGALLQVGAGIPQVVWQNKQMKNHFNSCVLVGGHLYGIDGNSDQPAEIAFRCLDFQTGEVKWSHKGFGLGALMAADGKLIILGDKGELVVAEASPAGFKPLAHAQVLGGKCWTTPVLANGKIYCRNAKGDLVCLDVKK
ncbi:MAG: PQQ-binding-like beta-propeller repeat protein [Verrucomicrobiota bacterium]